MENRQGQVSESIFIGVLLTLVGGFLDAYTYVLRGRVFANAQTGNIVLLGLNLAEMQFQKAGYYLVPILSFALGVIISEAVRGKFQKASRFHWRQIITAAEILILAAVAFLPKGEGDMLANLAISFICAMQVESFRKINGVSIATTMCTGNLRSGTELLYRFAVTKGKKERNQCLQYYGIILCFIAGAFCGTILTQVFYEKSVLFCCAVLAVGFGAMFVPAEIEVLEAESEGRRKEKAGRSRKSLRLKKRNDIQSIGIKIQTSGMRRGTGQEMHHERRKIYAIQRKTGKSENFLKK